MAHLFFKARLFHIDLRLNENLYSQKLTFKKQPDFQDFSNFAVKSKT